MAKKSKKNDDEATNHDGDGDTVEVEVKDEKPLDLDVYQYQVSPKKKVKLADVNANGLEEFKKKALKKELERQRARIIELQERLYAEGKQSLLIVLQAMDTGGKDGTIRRVFEGVNPQGCQVVSFKAPSSEELSHDFLWRIHQKAPARGMITVFNRSQYEDVLIVRVKNLVDEKVWRKRYDMINQFEQYLIDNGTQIVKFYLHIDKAEQKARFQERIDDPAKQWKFALGDLKEREFWDDYQAAYQDAINLCSTEAAPWFTVPANRNWFRNVIVARVIADKLEAMNPQYPVQTEKLEGIVIPD